MPLQRSSSSFSTPLAARSPEAPGRQSLEGIWGDPPARSGSEASRECRHAARPRARGWELLRRVALVGLAGLVLAGCPGRIAGAGSGGAATVGETGSVHHNPRRTKVVEVVEKTRGGIVAVQVLKRGPWESKSIVGTGVIVDQRGYVLTNHHVIASGECITVRLPDGQSVRPRVCKDLPDSDLAILYLPGQRGLQALTLAPGSDLMVGEEVIVVGHPYGYLNTVSTGIISAVGREITMPSGEVLTNLIQTDVSINPGNSGGPVFNIEGELIGINVAIRDGAQGIAFALNADTIKAVLSRHLSASAVSGVETGLRCREVVRGEAQERQQVVVEEVDEEGPAARAGLRRGDVIRRVAGQAVSNRFDLERALWGCKPGEQIEATVVRRGRERSLALELERAGTARRLTSRPALSRTPAERVAGVPGQ